MTLTTSLEGRVRNTPLPLSQALLPLFEAVVNSIQSIDQRPDQAMRGRVEVHVVRRAQDPLHIMPQGSGRVASDPIIAFKVKDDGIGFTDENMESFQTLDSPYKAEMGCKGMGRLLWLQAFEEVRVSSVFRSAKEKLTRREFSFSIQDEVSNVVEEDSSGGNPSTTVSLLEFREKYQKQARKTPEAIARDILEHCMWYFLRPGGAPLILVVDEDETVNLDHLMEEYGHDEVVSQQVDIKGVDFDMLGLKMRSRRAANPTLHWCAASRVVEHENISGKVPGLYSKMRDESGEFTFECYLTSDYLDAAVQPDRLAFAIPEKTQDLHSSQDPLFGVSEITRQDIRQAVFSAIEASLAEELAQSRNIGKERVATFVAQKAPRYRSMLGRFDDMGLAVDPALSDRELELHLHRQLQEVEVEVLKEGQEILDGSGSSWDDESYVSHVHEYMDKVDDLKKSDLAGYVSHRRVVLDLLERLVEADRAGKYVQEKAVHTLLMPMKTTSNDRIAQDASNLWIIDERLAFHEYLASDLPMNSMSISDSASDKRPDLLGVRLADTVLVSAEDRPPLASIVVVEIKRPMRRDVVDDGRDPIDQALEYLDLVRMGRVTTATGRQIPASSDLPGFCYVLADLTPTMIKRCKKASLTRAQDGLSYFGYNPNYGVYLEVISFDGLINGAKQRNRAFFDKLGLPV